MKKLLLVIPLAALLCIGSGTPCCSVAVGQQREARPKWEYKALTRSEVEELAPKKSTTRLTDALNTLGGEGWELVAVETDVSGGSSIGGGGTISVRSVSTFLFKRLK